MTRLMRALKFISFKKLFSLWTFILLLICHLQYEGMAGFEPWFRKSRAKRNTSVPTPMSVLIFSVTQHVAIFDVILVALFLKHSSMQFKHIKVLGHFVTNTFKSSRLFNQPYNFFVYNCTYVTSIPLVY